MPTIKVLYDCDDYADLPAKKRYEKKVWQPRLQITKYSRFDAPNPRDFSLSRIKFFTNPIYVMGTYRSNSPDRLETSFFMKDLFDAYRENSHSGVLKEMIKKNIWVEQVRNLYFCGDKELATRDDGDCEHIGFIACPKCTNLGFSSKEWEEHLNKQIEQELKEYNHYARSECYKYTLVGEDDNVIPNSDKFYYGIDSIKDDLPKIYQKDNLYFYLTPNIS